MVNRPRKGQGIVEFANRRDLDYALDNKRDLELDGRRLKIREAGVPEADRLGSLNYEIFEPFYIEDFFFKTQTKW